MYPKQLNATLLALGIPWLGVGACGSSVDGRREVDTQAEYDAACAASAEAGCRHFESCQAYWFQQYYASVDAYGLCRGRELRPLWGL
jgi:hypothetical protein